ncbi:MAG: YraN family protein [Candidatus Shapirobacteria bacterium]|jgi:putative endonuclease
MKVKVENYSKGRSSEERARMYLEKKGLGWIESNFLCHIGEIDLVMTDRDRLVFVEVKFKTDNKFGTPEEMISGWKIAQIRRVAQIYLIERPEVNKNYSKYRIDAVCLLGENTKHYKDIQ